MVYSPIPFTNSFIGEVKARITKERLSQTVVKEKELSERCEEAYRAWSEEQLKGCPQFMRKFTSVISVCSTSNNYWGRGVEVRYLEFKAKQKVCMVPKFTNDDSNPSSVQINQYHPLFADFVELSNLRKALKLDLYNKKIAENSGTGKAKNFKNFCLWCETAGYQDILDKMTEEYVDRTKEELNNFILSAFQSEAVTALPASVENSEPGTAEKPVVEEPVAEEPAAEEPVAKETSEEPVSEEAGENQAPPDWTEKDSGSWTQLELF
jgi:hypothetical protein